MTRISDGTFFIGESTLGVISDTILVQLDQAGHMLRGLDRAENARHSKSSGLLSHV